MKAQEVRVRIKVKNHCFKVKRKSLDSKWSFNSPCSEQNLYDRMIPRNTVFTKLACLFHIIVNISFSYDLFIRK